MTFFEFKVKKWSKIPDARCHCCVQAKSWYSDEDGVLNTFIFTHTYTLLHTRKHTFIAYIVKYYKSFQGIYAPTLWWVWSHPSKFTFPRWKMKFQPSLRGFGWNISKNFLFSFGKNNNRLHVVHFRWLRQNGSFMCEWVYWA